MAAVKSSRTAARGTVRSSAKKTPTKGARPKKGASKTSKSSAAARGVVRKPAARPVAAGSKRRTAASTPSRSAGSKTPARRAAPAAGAKRGAAAKKTTAARRTVARKAAPAKVAAAKKTAKKLTARGSAVTSRKNVPAPKKVTPAKSTAKKAPAKKTQAKKTSEQKGPAKATSIKARSKAATPPKGARKLPALTSPSRERPSAPAKPAPAPMRGTARTKSPALKKKVQPVSAKSIKFPKGIFSHATGTDSSEPFKGSELEHFREMISSMREDQQEQFEELTEQLKELNSAEANDENNAYSLHMAEQGTDAMEREKTFLQAQRVSDYIKKLDETMRRIDEGSFGLCRICGLRLDRMRLEAVPVTQVCTHYKKASKPCEPGRIFMEKTGRTEQLDTTGGASGNGLADK